MLLHDTKNFTVASLSDSLNCNLWCLQIPDIHLGCKAHGTGTRALLLCMVPPQPSAGSEVKCKFHGSIPRLRLCKINLFSGIISSPYIEFFGSYGSDQPTVQ